MILLPSASPPSTLNKDGTVRKPHERKPLLRIPLAESEGGKQCTLCLDFLTPESFPVSRDHSTGRYGQCRECCRQYRETHKYAIKLKNRELYDRKREELRAQALQWRLANPASIMLNGARRRARQLKVPCTITLEDIVIPEFCPALGIPLARNITGKRFTCQTQNSPNLDRIVPRLGYVPGNVQVISRKANGMKWSRSPEDWERFARWILMITDARRAADSV